MNKKKLIASETGCTHCWGSGVKEQSPFYYEVCFYCGGTGLIKTETPKK